MQPQMRYLKRRYFLDKIFNDFESARKYAKQKRYKTHCYYKITKAGLIGGWEVWLTMRQKQY